MVLGRSILQEEAWPVISIKPTISVWTLKWNGVLLWLTRSPRHRLHPLTSRVNTERQQLPGDPIYKAPATNPPRHKTISLIDPESAGPILRYLTFLTLLDCHFITMDFIAKTSNCVED